MSHPVITFICSGNICRSPMAAALTAKLLADRGIEAEVGSAGTYGIEAHPAAPLSIEMMAELGIDLSAHRSRGLTARLVRRSTHIIPLAPEHEEVIVTRFPEVIDRVHPLWKYATDPGRLALIADPFGRVRSEFLRCRDDLVECVGNLVEALFGSA